MSRNRPIYNTKFLANYGAYLSVAVVVIMLSGRLIIPPLRIDVPVPQMKSLNGISLKFDDSPSVSLFFHSIKSHHGYLCIGTSESDNLPGGNYYDFLNNDTDIESRFSVLAGAGRTCGLFIPVLLSHRKEVDSLNIIYLINPVYWRTDLANVNLEYWDRYQSYPICNHIPLNDEERKMFYQPVNAYMAGLNLFQKAAFTVEYEIRKFRKSFFQDLKYDFNPTSYLQTLKYLPEKKLPLSNFSNFGAPNLKSIDTLWNISRSFTNKQWFKPIDEKATYRYNELSCFINTCHSLDVNALFVIVPYNGKFIEQYDKAALAGYQQTTRNIRNLLISKKVAFIDETKLSFVKGAFIDHQHYSSYAAYFIYKDIKSLINEKRPD